MTIKSKFERKQTLHSNLSEKKALFTDVDHVGREKPGVYLPGNMFSKPSAWSLNFLGVKGSVACAPKAKRHRRWVRYSIFLPFAILLGLTCSAIRGLLAIMWDVLLGHVLTVWMKPNLSPGALKVKSIFRSLAWTKDRKNWRLFNPLFVHWWSGTVREHCQKLFLEAVEQMLVTYFCWIDSHPDFNARALITGEIMHSRDAQCNTGDLTHWLLE